MKSRWKEKRRNMRQDREEREEIKTCGMGGGMGKEDKNIIWQRKEGEVEVRKAEVKRKGKCV